MGDKACEHLLDANGNVNVSQTDKSIDLLCIRYKIVLTVFDLISSSARYLTKSSNSSMDCKYGSPKTSFGLAVVEQASSCCKPTEYVNLSILSFIVPS